VAATGSGQNGSLVVFQVGAFCSQCNAPQGTSHLTVDLLLLFHRETFDLTWFARPRHWQELPVFGPCSVARKSILMECHISRVEMGAGWATEMKAMTNCLSSPRAHIRWYGLISCVGRYTTAANIGQGDSIPLFVSLQVLATGDELRQLPSSQFYVEGPTVAVGSLLEETRIVQVYSSGVRLLNAGKFGKPPC